MTIQMSKKYVENLDQKFVQSYRKDWRQGFGSQEKPLE